MSLLRVVGLARRRTTVTAVGTPAERESRQRSRRHPAMAGLNVSPVHGRHCICERCAPEPEQRDAA